MEKPDIRFSIITPVYNRSDCISRCIDSVIMQNRKDLECWIIDDGSSDNTFEIVSEYAESNSFIRTHKFETNKGVNAARNYAIEKASGKYIIFLDSDDFFVKDAIDTIDRFLIKNPCYRHYLFLQDDREEYYKNNSFLFKQGEVVELMFENFLSGQVSGDFVHVMDADILKKYPFEESLRIYEALSLLKVIRECKKILLIPSIISKRERNRKDSVSRDYIPNKKSIISNKYHYAKSWIATFKDDFPSGEKDILAKIVVEAYLLGLALGKYKELDSFITLSFQLKKIPWYYRIFELLRLGWFVRYLIFVYTSMKNYKKVDL